MNVRENTNCPYCKNILHGKPKYDWDDILLESSNFVVTPTKGSLIPGWLLVIPKSHVSSFSKLPSNLLGECTKIISTCNEILMAEFGPVTIFEHGSNVANDLVGCGVNHAHLHLASLPFEMNVVLESNAAFKNRTTIKQNFEMDIFSSFDNEKSYYFYKAFNSNKYSIAYPEEKESQFFRKIIAEEVGLKNQFDYREYDFLKNVIFTKNKFKLSKSLVA